MSSLRIVFMGTPEFAVPSLEILERHYQVAAVITAPDKPRGRGRKLLPSPVKVSAMDRGIPLLQPPNLKSPAFLEELKAIGADLQVVVAFRMLPEVVWSMPSLGTFNLHASLLPKYRGAAPINWAIINGEKTTGLTTFFLKHEIDTGNIILQQEESISPTDTAGSLYRRLMHQGADLVLDTVRLIEDGNYQLTPQDFDPNLPKAPKIHKPDCEIDWTWSALQIYNLVRGLNPVPTARTSINGVIYKILQVKILEDNLYQDDPGSFYTDNLSFLHFCTGDGVIAVEQLQAPGKKAMNIGAFLRGNQL